MSINIYHIVLYKAITLKKNLMQNLIKIYTKAHQIAHFSKFSRCGAWPYSMCAADIIISSKLRDMQISKSKKNLAHPPPKSPVS